MVLKYKRSPGSFCYWADRTKNPETIRRTRLAVVELLKQRKLPIVSGRYCLVYVAVNVINNHLYVGCTRVGLPKRRTAHIWKASRGGRTKFCSAIRKYGSKSFVWYPFVYCASFAQALKVEENLIDSWRPEYNIARGGQGSLGFKQKPEVIARIRAAKLGSHHTKKARKALSRATRNWWVERRKQLDFEQFSKNRYENSLVKSIERLKRPVVCIDTGETFSSIADAARLLGLRSSQVSYICEHPHYKPHQGKKKPKLAFLEGDANA